MKIQSTETLLRQTAARCALALLACLGLLPVAHADLALFPTRIVFEKNQRAAQVELMNTGSVAATYRASLVNRRMGVHGEFLAVETPGPGEQFDDELLRFSPRQVTIQPGSSQTVRVLLRKPAELAAGEYRSHLQFDRAPEATGSSNVETLAPGGGDQVGVVIQALIGASIPVIVRHGDIQASVTLSDLSLQPAAGEGQPPVLSLQLNRSGNRSVYGDLVVVHEPRGGAPVQIALAGGVAIYVPNPLRRASLPLQVPAGIALAGGTLAVTYRERAEAGGRVLTQARLALP